MKNFKVATCLSLALTTQFTQASEGNPSNYQKQLHPPVKITEEGASIAVLFLKSNSEEATGEIVYLQTEPFLPELNYVWKIVDDEIVANFVYSGDSEARGKSLFLITRNKINNSSFHGHSYSSMELPLILEDKKLILTYFPEDLAEEKLTNCYDGYDPSSHEKMICPYKDELSVKKYLRSRE